MIRKNLFSKSAKFRPQTNRHPWRTPTVNYQSYIGDAYMKNSWSRNKMSSHTIRMGIYYHYLASHAPQYWRRRHGLRAQRWLDVHLHRIYKRSR
jgi:hypothetical protein